MHSFIIYNSATGVVLGAITTNDDSGLDTVMAANTPAGASALAIDSDHPAMTDQRNWSVVNGELVAVVPTDAELLAAAQATQSNLIEAAYQQATYGTPIAYMDTTFFADQTSQSMLTGALTVLNPAGATPEGFAWWDSTNTAVPMTLSQLQGLAVAILTKVNANFGKRKTLLASIEAATSIASTQSINW